jgi:hypothetical protein
MAGRIAYYGNIVKNGLVFDLDAAKSDSYPKSGTVWRDVSGFQNNGTLTNGPTFDSNNGGSIVFDGVDDYVSIPDTPDLRLNGNFTISLWHKAITLKNTYPGPISKGNSGPGGTGYILFYVSLNNDYMFFKRNNQTFSLPNSVNSIWKHITFTYDGTNVRGYVNGVLGYTSSPATFPTNTDTNSLSLGRGDQYGNGAVANLGLYNRTLSATEVLQNYNALKGRYGL